MRRLAPKTAMSIAEFFRDQGQSVLLIIDSITRFAHAARDVAMAPASWRSRAAMRRASSAIYQNFSKERDREKKDKARSPAFFRFSSMETISTILSPMPFAARSTDISSSTAPSPTRDDTRPSTF